jgi:hypothetical protein
MISITPTKEIENVCASHASACIGYLSRATVRKLDKYFDDEVGMKLIEVLSAPYELLELIKDIVGTSKKFPAHVNELKKLYKVFGDTKKTFGKNKYGVIDLVLCTGMKVCPYCNRNYITTVKKDKNVKLRMAQIDHFWNKKEYPYLAMSFYNLIPCCGYCNQKKSTNMISISPYNPDYNLSKLFKFSHSVIPHLPFDPKKIDISIKSVDLKHKSNIDVFSLEELYKTHTNVVYDTYLKFFCYSPSRIDELYELLSFIFQSKDELRKVLFNLPLNEEDFKSQPLSKLVLDLIKKYETDL